MSLPLALIIAAAAVVCLIGAQFAKYTILTVICYDAPKEISVLSKHHGMPIAKITKDVRFSKIYVAGLPPNFCPPGKEVLYLKCTMQGRGLKSRRPYEHHIILRCDLRDRIIHAAKQKHSFELSKLKAEI